MRFNAYFDRYQKVLPRGHILRYEDIVSSGGRALKFIHPASRRALVIERGRLLELLQQGERRGIAGSANLETPAYAKRTAESGPLW